MTHRRKRLLRAAICLSALLLTVWMLPRLASHPLPSLTSDDRTLLRIWVISSPGGGQAWLKSQLRQFEKQHPTVSTYVRTVSAAELTAPDALMPDIVLYMPGDVTDPAVYFLPLSGEMVTSDGLLREELLRCGRWQGQQYALPLCWGTWVLAIDSALEPGNTVTPAPTTLLGHPIGSDTPAVTESPAYPLEAARQAACTLQSPGGTALFTLGLLVEERPPLPETFATLTSTDVYASFQRRQCATAMITTGQATAFAGLTNSGSGFPHRIMAAEEMITDQVFLASVTAEAPKEAALLLSFLTAAEGQRALSTQGLHTVRSDLTMYATGLSAQVEQAGRRVLTAINAYIPADTVRHAAWQFFQGQLTLDEALLPLL